MLISVTFLQNKTICVSQSKHKVEYYTKEQQGVLYLDESLGELTVGILQRFLDDYVCDIDYIHDNDVLTKLSCKSDCIGLLLSDIDKENLFSEIIKMVHYHENVFHGICSGKR